MSILKELGISELGDNLRGLTSSTKMHYKNFDIKCGNSETDQMLAGYGDDKERWEEVKNQEVEEQNKLEYVRVTHNYLPQETTILDLHLYRSQEI